jgi:hypothetical protein
MSAYNLPGVVASTTKQRSVGKPRTVAAITELRQFLVTFYDDSGEEHTDILLKAGDTFYASRGGEDWCSRLGTPTKWLAAEVSSRIAAKEKAVAPVIPSKDTVSVIAQDEPDK